MRISRKEEASKIEVGDTMVVHEYAPMSEKIHGALVELNGRYPKQGRVVNEVCAELAYVIKGSGKLIIEDDEIEFEEGDQMLIDPGEKYYWIANATMFMLCSPAWYPDQHRGVE